MTISDDLTRTQINAVAVQSITDAVSAVGVARQGPSYALVEIALSQLVVVVQLANQQGLSWQSIGDTIGIARGNAYQRYRRRPEPRAQGGACPTGPALTPPGP